MTISVWTLARGNHKGTRVDKYHIVLKKTQAIVGQYRGTHINILQNIKTSKYAWNNVPIYDTDKPRSVASVGREFKFPLDVDIVTAPTLDDEKNSMLSQYLLDV